MFLSWLNSLLIFFCQYFVVGHPLVAIYQCDLKKQKTKHKYLASAYLWHTGGINSDSALD